MEINFAEADWNEDLVLQRYELLYEAGLAPEALRGKRAAADALPAAAIGVPMHYDHRRILATGIARLRAKIKYRPVVFELMPPAFTLGPAAVPPSSIASAAKSCSSAPSPAASYRSPAASPKNLRLTTDYAQD